MRHVDEKAEHSEAEEECKVEHRKNVQLEVFDSNANARPHRMMRFSQHAAITRCTVHAAQRLELLRNINSISS